MTERRGLANRGPSSLLSPSLPAADVLRVRRWRRELVGHPAVIRPQALERLEAGSAAVAGGLLGVRMNPAPGVDGVKPGAYVETVTGEASLVGLGSLDEGSRSSGCAVCRKARCHGRAAWERRAGCLRRRRGCGHARGAGRADGTVLGADPGSGDVAVAAFAVGLELGVAGQIDREFEHAECDPFGEKARIDHP